MDGGYWLAGGDARQAYLAGLLAREGARVSVFALEGGARLIPGVPEEDAPRPGDTAILPLPVCGRDGALFAPLCPRTAALDDVLARCRAARLVCGGRVTQAVRAAAAGYGLTVRDYFTGPALALRNAVPTAEGALALAMEALPVTVQGARVLILGFGPVGQACALRFAALGARVCVWARREEQRAAAFALGLRAEPFGLPEGYDLAVNTVPAPVLGEAELSALPAGAPVIELASAPGGADAGAAERLGVRLIAAPGLPGKAAPASAAAYLRDAILSLE